MTHTSMKLRINVTIDANDHNSKGTAFGNLQLHEEFDVQARDFLEMAKILGQFHELAGMVNSK